MPEIQAIAEYLRNMTFKHRAFGGIDTENVLDHFSRVTLQYEAILSGYLAQNGEAARQIAGLQMEIEQVNQKNTALNQYYRELFRRYEEANACLKLQNDWMQQQAMSLLAELDQIRRLYYAQG